MAIRHKRKTTTGYTWTGTDLVDGQLGINTTDGTVHLKKGDNSYVKLESSRASTGSNTDITSLTGLTGGISTADYVTFDTGITPVPAEGRLTWDSDNGTLQVGLSGGAVNLQIGQEEVLRIHNNTGSTLTDGQVVYINGSSGNRPTVALASASSESTSSVTMGVVTEAILNGAEGFVTTSGLVNGLDTSAFSAGAAIWLSTTAGTFTATKPSAPNHGVLIGFVIRSHATIGSILVKIQNGSELSELHDVSITTPQNNQLLIYNSSSGVWINANAPTELPTQTGQTGKYLTTDGSSVSWATVASSGGGSIDYYLSLIHI